MSSNLRRKAALTALAQALRAGAHGGPPLGQRLAALPRMIRATIRGEYDGGLRLALMTAAAAYVVSPIDLAPELLMLIFGLADDLVVVTWLAGTVLAETERFLIWERHRGSVIPGHVVP